MLSGLLVALAKRMSFWNHRSKFRLAFFVYTLVNCQPNWAMSCVDSINILPSNTEQRPYTDQDFQNIARSYGNPPATYSTGDSYGSAPENIPLFRGVTGPDHDFNSILQFIGGNRRYELMSPTFRRALNSALASRSFNSAYEEAKRISAQEIIDTITKLGLKGFALKMMCDSSTGLSQEKKNGPILKFTNELNSALNYAASNFERNLNRGRRLNPVVFDASNNGGLTLGDINLPKPGHYHEYDFLSNVSIRHVNAVFVGLVRPNSTTAWDMPWIKISPQKRRADGAYQTIFVEFVTIEKKIPLDIYKETGVWPEYELINLKPQKPVGLFDLNGQIKLSPELNASDLLSIKPLLAIYELLK